MIAFRDRTAKELGLDLMSTSTARAWPQGIGPFDHGAAVHTDIMKTEALKQALDLHGFDAAIGGARRDEEASRAKERVFSLRSARPPLGSAQAAPGAVAPLQRPAQPGESIRVFPLSNWTELDIWTYIERENIAVVRSTSPPERPVVERDGTLDHDRRRSLALDPGEVPQKRWVRFRTLGCYPLTGAIESQRRRR